MLENHYFTPEFIISPLESAKSAVTKGADGSHTLVTSNFSYAMLDISKGARARVHEWAATANSEGAVISDRSKAIVPAGDSLDTTSLHVNTTAHSSEAWQGGVAWNDNHVTFEEDGFMKTRYGTLPTDRDDIFVDAGGDGLMGYD